MSCTKQQVHTHCVFVVAAGAAGWTSGNDILNIALFFALWFGWQNEPKTDDEFRKNLIRCAHMRHANRCLYEIILFTYRLISDYQSRNRLKWNAHTACAGLHIRTDCVYEQRALVKFDPVDYDFRFSAFRSSSPALNDELLRWTIDIHSIRDREEYRSTESSSTTIFFTRRMTMPRKPPRKIQLPPLVSVERFYGKQATLYFESRRQYSQPEQVEQEKHREKERSNNPAVDADKK